MQSNAKMYFFVVILRKHFSFDFMNYLKCYVFISQIAFQLNSYS